MDGSLPSKTNCSRLLNYSSPVGRRLGKYTCIATVDRRCRAPADNTLDSESVIYMISTNKIMPKWDRGKKVPVGPWNPPDPLVPYAKEKEDRGNMCPQVLVSTTYESIRKTVGLP